MYTRKISQIPGKFSLNANGGYHGRFSPSYFRKFSGGQLEDSTLSGKNSRIRNCKNAAMSELDKLVLSNAIVRKKFGVMIGFTRFKFSLFFQIHFLVEKFLFKA